MTRFAESYAVWLGDYYLLAAVLLSLSLAGIALLKQPAQRLMVTKSTLAALVLLAILCAVPGWSLVHLLAAERPAARLESVYEEPMSHADSIVHPELSQANPAPHTALPPLAVPTADETSAKPIAPKINWPASLAIAHLLGVGGITIWLALGWVASLRLRRTALPAPASIRTILDQLATLDVLGSNRPQLVTHDRVDVAVALGVWSPMILLPSRWAATQSPDRLQAVLAHEATHVLNRDLQWVALVRALFVPLWANPLFWLAKRRLRLDQEALADAAAAEITSRQQYAEQLVAWARDARSRPALHLSSAVGLWEGPSQLRQRIAILLDEKLTVLRDCSGRWRIASVALCGIIAVVLSLVTLQPGQSAPPPDETKLSKVDADRVALAIKVLRETDGTGTQAAQMDLGNGQIGRVPVNDGWADAVRTLVQIGKPAVPAIAAALDEEDRNHPIRKLAFTLRAIGDPRAVPALIRALPRTLVPSCSDCVEYMEDPELLKFMQKHDLNAGESGNTFSYGRPFREVVDALRKLTRANQNDTELNWMFLAKTPVQRDAQRKLFYDLAQRWEAWWSQNWQRLGVGNGYAAVNLPPLKLELLAAEAARTPALLTGPKLGLVGGFSGKIIQSAHESKQLCFIDFDTGRETGWPKELPPLAQMGADDQRIATWADKQGLDLMGITYQPPGYDAPIYCLQPLGMKVWQLTPEEQRLLTKAIMGEIPYPLGHPVDRLIPRKETYEGPDKNELGGTAFLFLTREGTAGLLRMTAQVTDTHVQSGQRSSPDDQFSPIGHFRGAKISYSLIGETQDPDVRRVGESRLILGSGTPPVIESKPAAGNNNGWTPRPTDTDRQKGALRGGPPRPEPNTISGRVVDEKGRPLPDAEVIVFRVTQPDFSRKLIGKQKTAADGRFQIDNVVDIAKEFPNKKFPAFIYSAGGDLIQAFVRLPGRVTQSSLDNVPFVAQFGAMHYVELLPAAKLRGRVTGPEGEPVAGALVSVGSGTSDRWDGVNSSRTDADGNYEIDDGAPFDLAKYTEQVERRIPASANWADNDRGTATGARTVGEPTTGDSQSVPPFLTVQHPKYAVKHLRVEKSPGTQDIKLTPPASLEGRVIFADSGEPAGGAVVVVASLLDRPYTYTSKSIPACTSVHADENGHYRFANLPEGKYELWSSLPGWLNDTADKVSAVAGKTAAVPDLKFTRGAATRVRLVDEKTRAAVKLEAGSQAIFLVRPLPQYTSLRPLIREVADVNAEGICEIHTTTGRKQLTLFGLGIGGASNSVRGARPIEVAAREGQVTEIEMPVIGAGSAKPAAEVKKGSAPKPNPPQAAPNTITGRVDENGAPNAAPEALVSGPVLKGHVVAESGKPVSDVTVVLYGGLATRFRGQETKTDDKGNYEFKPLKTGAMEFPENGRSDWFTGVQFKHPEFVPADGKSWRDISVPNEPDHVEVLDLKMVGGGKIRATVIDPTSSKPISDLDLRIYNGSLDRNKTGDFLAYAKTDAEGSFTSEPLFPGHYVVEINDNNYRGKNYPKIGQADVRAGETTSLRLIATTSAQEKAPAAAVAKNALANAPAAATKQSDERRFKANEIIGRATDEKGQPIAGAAASLFRINRIDSSRKLQAKTTTDADGRYQFENVIDIAKEFPGATLNPLNHTFNPLEEEFVQVFVRAPSRVAGSAMDFRQQIALTGRTFDMKLKPSATLTGRVTGPDGKPIAGALVAVGGSNFSTWDGVASARTKADGTYVISDAAPYGVEEYRKQMEEQNRQIKARAAAKQDTFVAFVTPPVLTVSHADFATKNAIYQKIPGNQDVKLEPGAIVEGRAIYGDSAKPAAGVIVHLATSQPKDPKPGEDQFTPNPVAFDTRTDADGKYRFTALPAVSYDLSAEMPGWVIGDINALPAPSGKTSTAPNLVLTKGGVISIRLIDDKIGKPIALTPGIRADVAAHKFPFPKGPSRPSWMPNAAANSAGRFELHTPPGKRAVMVNQVVENGELRWIPKRSLEFKPTVVDVVDGNMVEVDLPVVDRDPVATWPQGDGDATLFSIAPQIPQTDDGQPTDKTVPKNNDTLADPPTPPAKTQPQSDTAPKEKDSANQPVEFKIIVAKYFLLLNGEGIQWSEIEKSITALPDPKQARLRLYFTAGAPQLAQDAMLDKAHQLEKQYHCKLSQFGGVGQRAGVRYDAIRGEIDLVPKRAWRVDGLVQSGDGKNIVGAEVILCPPAEPSWTFKNVDIHLQNGRLREPLDEILAHSDANGKFAVYPTPNTQYYLVALHREGFGLARSDEFAKSKRIQIQPWAKVSGRIGGVQKFKQVLFLVGSVPAADGWPNVEFHQYSDEQIPKQPMPDGKFVFNFVPPNVNGVLSRLIGGEDYPYKTFRVAPGAAEPIDVEQPTEADAKKFEQASKKGLFD
jgi:beta-lactamase regulating signal transducer with metallopeptidase domain/protocatechuate 3,4-dioxygenase beta subunit